jgi:hypothetical protein
MKRSWVITLVTIPLGLVVACDGSNPVASSSPEYDPDIPTEWAAAVTNPYFPLTPGSSWTYESETEDGSETIQVEVLAQKRIIMGVEATIVHDQVFLDGELIENTFDWYAQALNGDVWYLGEDTEELEDGMVLDTEGSFEWGVDGALPGIIMWANPAAHINEEYRQEFYEGEAEDWGKVTQVAQDIAIPFGDFDDCVVTDDWNGLEPGTLESKTYCPGIGVVYEAQVEGGDEEVFLVEFEAP